MYGLLQALCGLIFIAMACGQSHASGDFTAPTMLDNGGKEVLGTPEFFWELECKRIATEFVPPEKRVVSMTPAKAPTNDSGTVPSDSREEFTTAKDLADFKAALVDGTLKPADATKATAAHTAAREVVKQASLTRVDGQLPEETPGEFTEYHKGALAYKTWHDSQALAAWKGILAKPAGERKYRSTWAAYMLGRCSLNDHQFTQAIDFFKQTRQLAKDGFVDSLGLAAESYGWEARCELELGHPEASARLYLTQLATGDASAVVSLKWFIPDWGLSVKGKGSEDTKPGLNTELSDNTDNDTGPTTSVPRGPKAMDAAAHSPLLRRLVSAHILATTDGNDVYSDLSPEERGATQNKWLAALDQAGVKDTTDAEYIGWVAYSAGKYSDAKRWLAKSPGTSAAALWLQAKLALRDGKTINATKLLSQALRAFPMPRAELENSVFDYRYITPAETAYGELGILRLAQADFVQALDAFIASGFWYDAAYVAERCLTKKELLDYTRNQKFADISSKTPSKTEPTGWTTIDNEYFHYAISPLRFRDLIGRRMVREKDYQTAREFFAPEKIKILDEYSVALAKGMNASKTKHEQARALFHAAWIARFYGMELMGTEIGPDSSINEGAYNEGDLAMARLTGKEPAIEDDDDAWEYRNINKLIDYALPVTRKEKDRLKATKLVVERRFHYRLVAADLAWKASALLPKNSEEAADVLNSAGNWLKVRHEKQAERFYDAIESRCPATDIGKQVVAKHWFIDAKGQWSNEESEQESRYRPPQ